MLTDVALESTLLVVEYCNFGSSPKPTFEYRFRVPVLKDTMVNTIKICNKFESKLGRYYPNPTRSR